MQNNLNDAKTQPMYLEVCIAVTRVGLELTGTVDGLREVVVGAKVAAGHDLFPASSTEIGHVNK